MRNSNYGLYAIALAIVVVGAMLAGVPVRNLAVLGVVLVCPLMMFFMMRGMHGGGQPDQHDHQHDDSDHDHQPSTH